jgi:regulatory protein
MKGSTALGRAVARLARRDHSEAELRAALAAEGWSPSETDAALARLRESRYVDDEGLAGRFARSRLLGGTAGTRRIRQTLRSRGVAAEASEQGVAAALAETSEADAVDAVARKHWGRRPGEDPRRRLRRVAALLLRRGFPAALVQERLTALWPRWSEAIAGLTESEDGEES